MLTYKKKIKTLDNKAKKALTLWVCTLPFDNAQLSWVFFPSGEWKADWGTIS